MSSSSSISPAHLNGLKNALQHGGGSHDLSHVWDAVHAGKAQLWVEGDACIVTEVNDAPNHSELHFWLATGSLDDVIALSNKLLVWGKEMGCDVATLSGRRGWTKALAAEGWEPQMVTMARRL